MCIRDRKLALEDGTIRFWRRGGNNSVFGVQKGVCRSAGSMHSDWDVLEAAICRAIIDVRQLYGSAGVDFDGTFADPSGLQVVLSHQLARLEGWVEHARISAAFSVKQLGDSCVAGDL